VGAFERLVDDAAMFPPGDASPAAAVRAHREYRDAWFADLIGPLVVPDTQLSRVARELADSPPLRVSVVNTGGAGGLLALAERKPAGVTAVAVESALRDLDDLAGNAARVVSAAAELGDDTAVFVEIPYAPGWVDAVEVVEAAGLFGKIRTGGVNPEDYPTADRLADQLSVLIEADLPFKATAGLHHAWPSEGRNTRGQALRQHGFLTLMMAIEALIDGAECSDAAELLRLEDRGRIRDAIGGWDEAAARRVRRRFSSFGCCGVTDPVDDLRSLGVVAAP
jgi:hypothetical protein